MVWKQCFYVGLSLFRLWKAIIFGARAGFVMDASHVFPRSVLVIVPLMEV